MLAFGRKLMVKVALSKNKFGKVTRVNRFKGFL